MVLPVQKRIRKVYDHLYANAAMKTPAGIALELGKIAHTCAFLEQTEAKSSAFELSPADARSIGAGAGTLFAHDISERVRLAFDRMISSWRIYSEGDEINLSDYDIAFSIAQFSGLSFTDPKTDLIGDIFEVVRSQFAKEVGGQFFTDPQVTHLAMKLLEFSPAEGDDLVDICAGTGGFLLAGMAHLEESHASTDALYSGPITDLVQRTFLGVEIDPEAVAAANATIRARFGPELDDLVQQGDSLRLQPLSQRVGRLRPGTHRCVATNPPFGTKITVKDPAVLDAFEVSRIPYRGDARGGPRPTAPDTLFLEQNLNLLDPERGRLAIVVPYQLLSGPQAQSLRKWLIERVEIRAVVDLPPETFQPHTGTKGALLVVAPRRKPLAALDEAAGETVFMAVPRDIGHDRRGNPLFEVGSDGAETGRVRTDFPQVAEAFAAFRSGEDPGTVYDRCFTVSLGQILNSPTTSLNASFFRPSRRSDPRSRDSGAQQEDWEFQPLGNIVKDVFFPGRFKRNYVEESERGVPFLGGSNITEFVISSNKLLAADDVKLEALTIQPGWILITRSGSTGIVSTVPKEWAGFAMSEHVIRIVPDEGLVPGGYLYAVLSSSYGQEYLRRGIFGSVIDEITPDYVRSLPVPIPRDRALLETIGRDMRHAEEMRSEAMATFSKTRRSLDEALSGLSL